MYNEGQMTHFNIPLKHCNAERCWKEVDSKFNLAKQKEECAKFNAEHKYRKRGVCMTPLKFGIAFTFSPLNQGNCLLHIYKDGSVLISHGGTEMGQGLHTKMCQIAAQVLEIPVELVRIDETSTDKCANTSPTAASSGSDLNGHAVYDAAIQLKARLAPFRTPGKPWPQVCVDAYLAKTDLSAHGYYNMKDVCWDWEKGVGKPFQYYVYGASGSVVEIDTLTGDHQVIRSDVLFDVGESLNKGIDVGQVEGAFIQGYGWLTMEEYLKGNFEENRWIKPGKIHTNGPGYYKIPGFNDIPHEFNVGFLKDSMNSIGIFSSKAIGEPPFLLANSIAFAIVDAVRAARKENGLPTFFQYDFPMSAPRIKELCGAKISK
jgi:xanthine dehydrogenase/oxidase